MAKKEEFKIIITSYAERAYFEILEYVFEHHSTKRANEIAIDLLDHPKILKKFPLIGKIEPSLVERPEKYRFLLYERTKRITIKLIYYIDDWNKIVYLTDFFPCEMLEEKINSRK